MSEEQQGQQPQDQPRSGGQGGSQGQGGQPRGQQGQGQGQQHGQGGQGGQHGGHRSGRHRHRYRGHGKGGGGQHPQHGGGAHPQHGGGNQQHNAQRNHQGNRQQGARPGQPHQPTEAEKLFHSQTPVDPYQWIQLEKGSNDVSMRAMDLLCPIGRGTRGLIVAPPKAGKTTILKQISNAVHGFDPEIKQLVMLIDERPEEVTDFKRSVPAEVFASSSDQSYDQHVRLAETVMRTAIEAAASGKDVLLLLDSLTRLARVYNQFATGARTMSGGLDSRAMETPRRFFGAARKLENSGSLTIIASILVETGSRMDEVIFQEFKGTGNMEIVLSRQAAEMRMFPAMKVRDSGTRKEEKLLPPETLEGVWKLRRALAEKGDTDSLKAIIEALRVHKTNKAFLAALR